MGALKQELIDLKNEFFSGDYKIVDAKVVPSVEDLKFGKFGKELELTMLFVDIKDSTKISKHLHSKTAARMYQTYLSGISSIIRDKDGYIRSFNGDGVLAVFEVGGKNSNAVEAALKIVWFCKNVLAPKMNSIFATNVNLKETKFSFGVGVDTGKILVVRGGIKGANNNDLVWAGYATNRAVKLAELSDGINTVHISTSVYKGMLDHVIYKNPKALIKINMWKQVLDFKSMSTVYQSSYSWIP